MQSCTKPSIWSTIYPKKYAHGFCFAVLCCGYTLTDFPISIRLTSLALRQSNDCPSASKATLMNMDKYFTWIHYERLHDHNKAKHNKTVCIFLGIYCMQRVLFCFVCWGFIRNSYQFMWLTHWGWEMHICISKSTTMGSDNGMLPDRCQAIIWANAVILSIWSLGTNLSEILIKMHTFSSKKNALKNVVWKMTAILFWPQCDKTPIKYGIASLQLGIS